MRIKHTLNLGLASLFLVVAGRENDAQDIISSMGFAHIRTTDGEFLTALSVAIADEPVRTMKGTVIYNLRQKAILGVVDGEIGFRTRDAKSSWSLRIEKSRVTISRTGGGILGIDSKTKQLRLFDEPGSNTTWSVKVAGDYEIRPPFGFEAILFMKVGDEELRLSSDDDGTPMLGGKADILNFKREGA